jgi:UDPglucose--hexose-1-phosphate uridylyltransferase
MKPEIRKDYVEEEYVIIAPKRGKRPKDTKKKIKSDLKVNEVCVFCKEKQKNIKAELQYGKDDWRVKVIKNKYPAISLDNKDAYGTQEVVIESPAHNCMLHEQKEERVAEILKAYSDRTKALSENKKIQYILIFKNQGANAGASLRHAHSQIFAMGFLPPHLYEKSKRIHSHKLRFGRCVYCDVISAETKGSRLVYKDQNVIAFTPYASVHNYEVWIMPLRHIDNITLLNSTERKSFAKILKRILEKIKKLDLSYNFYFHQAVFDKDQHLYMKIKPRGSTWAGVELGAGIAINQISPEYAAKYYKKK